MKQPTKCEITKKIELVIRTKLTREEFGEWAINFIRNDANIPIEDVDAWHYLVAMSNIDEMIGPDEYLFSEEDIREIMKEYV